MLAEIYGKYSGCCGGRGGSMHLFDESQNITASVPIVASSIALAVGSALSSKIDTSKEVTVSFLGDGAVEEGIFHESLNFASLNKLPIIFVCENNLYATESPLSVRTPNNTTFIKKVESFAVKVFDCDGNDVFDVYEKTLKATKYMKKTSSPALIHARTYRWREHVGPLWDYEANRTYRDKKELEKWMKKCPVKRIEKFLISKNIISKSGIKDIKNQVDKLIYKDLEKAKLSNWPDPKDLFLNAGSCNEV